MGATVYSNIEGEKTLIRDRYTTRSSISAVNSQNYITAS